MHFSSDHRETKTDAGPSKVRVECLVLYLLQTVVSLLTLMSDD